jgi:SAM-dependent methyltransferase
MQPLSPSDIFDRLSANCLTDVQASIMQFRARACAQQYRLPYKITQQYLTENSKVLDWGCGNGHFSFFLTEAGHEVSAYNFGSPTTTVSHLLTQHAKKFRYTPGNESDPVTIPFESVSMDAVVSVGVLEHVRETGGTEPQSLAEISRVLKPGGVFICVHFPNRYSWIEAGTTVFKSRHHHRYRYTRNDIQRLAENGGFEVLMIRRYNAIPRNIFSSLGFAPGSRAIAAGADVIDTIAAWILNPFCQNYAFVLRKPPAPCQSS